MTAEISIMNKRAIALAADSAVTLGKGDKVFNTADKLFALSKYCPVGVMIYNNAEFMGVPWETIVKEYREQLKTKEFDTLYEYGDNFLEFLHNEKLNLINYEERYFINATQWLIKYINGQIQNKYNYAVRRLARKLEEDEFRRIISDTITSINSTIVSIADVEKLPENLEAYILEKYKSIADKIIDEIIGLSIIPEESLTILYSTIFKSFTKQMRTDEYTGIVIAGFGDADIFPKLVAYEVYGIMNNHLKYKKIREVEINTKQDYYIYPFAQTDTVDTFLHGISPNFLGVVNDYFERHILYTIDEFDDTIISKDNKTHIIQELRTKWKAVSEGITDYSNDKYFYPILIAIKSLPKDELASMAESLVNLTSFKRQVAMDENSHTVGGPIDVAVISKGDGFVWIKRKHYFSPELNNHFFKNYYRKCEEVGNYERLRSE